MVCALHVEGVFWEGSLSSDKISAYQTFATCFD